MIFHLRHWRWVLNLLSYQSISPKQRFFFSSFRRRQNCQFVPNFPSKFEILVPMSSKVVYEGWMVRYGRRKIGRSFIHMRYFVLESRLLAYYKRKPQDNQVPIKTLLIDGNCRVEDRGLKTHHGHVSSDILIRGGNPNHTIAMDYQDLM